MATENSDTVTGHGGFGETVKVIVHALLLALLVRTLLFQPFNIPSGSMKPTLLIGDYLFVSKYSYGYSAASLPFGLKLFQGRVWEGEPKRGDVAVFKLPRDGQTDYIKRVIGLPGDRIQMRDGVLYINEQPVKRERVSDFISDDPGSSGAEIAQYRETLPNGVSYLTLDLVPDGASDNTRVFEVPPRHYFMMGDNRDNSADSRVDGAFGVGYVPIENFVGRAEVIFFSIDEGSRFWEFWSWPVTVRWSRLFDLVGE